MATSNTIADFDALDGDKLVVTAAWENGSTSVDSITYGAQNFSSSGVIGTGAGRFFTIWYLDSPNTGANDLTVNFAGPSTGSRIHALSLSGAAAGDPVVSATAGQEDSGSGTISIDINIPEADTLVVGGYVENGAAPINGSLANEMYFGSSDSSSGWAGYQYEATGGLKTYSFTGVTNDSNGLAVAAFRGVAKPLNLPQVVLDERISEFEERRSQALTKQINDTFPGETTPAPTNIYAWNRLDFALAALYQNIQVAEANQAILDASAVFLAEDPETYAGAEFGLHWHGNLWVRIHELFCADSSHFPGRLTPDAEEAIRALLWQWASRVGFLDLADFETWKTWKIWESENHSAMHDATAWGAAKILRRYAPYNTYLYDDGTTAEAQYELWTDFLVEYLRERGQRGLTVEYRSNTYSKYTLQGIYNYYDLAENPNLHYLAQAFLDLWWADAAQENIDGLSGGAKTRMARPADINGQRHAVAQMIWYYTGEGQFQNTHPGLMCLITSAYRLPLVVMDIALDEVGRGSFESLSRRPGLNLAGFENFPEGYILDRGNGGILRYSWVTPDFVLGTHFFDKLPNDRWSNISSQNRWHGLIVKGSLQALIVPQVEVTTSNLRGYNEQWSIQHKGTLITQKCSTGLNLANMRVYFPDPSILVREEADGWIFAHNAYAFVAVRPARGGYQWLDDNWIQLSDSYSPVIIEVVRAADYPSFADFRSEILDQQIEINSTLGEEALFYTSLLEEAQFTFFIDPATTRAPEVNGEDVDHAPEFAFRSPFVEGTFPNVSPSSHGETPPGIVKIHKGKYEKVLNFKADFSDPEIPGEWIDVPILQGSVTSLNAYGENPGTIDLNLSEPVPFDIPVYIRLGNKGASQVELDQPANPVIIPAGSTQHSIDILRSKPEQLLLEDLVLEIYLSEADGYIWDYRNSFSLNLSALPYDHWRAVYFDPTQQTDSEISGPQASPAGDGVANIFKYLKGQSPWDSFSGLKAGMEIFENQIRIILPRSEQAVDLAVTPQHSEDLINWNDMSESDYSLNMNGFDFESGGHHIELLLPKDAASGRDLYRLEITHPLLY